MGIDLPKIGGLFLFPRLDLFDPIVSVESLAFGLKLIPCMGPEGLCSVRSVLWVIGIND